MINASKMQVSVFTPHFTPAPHLHRLARGAWRAGEESAERVNDVATS